MRLRRLALAAGFAGALVVAGAGAASSEATVVNCSDVVPGTQGTLIITPNGNVLANCFQHDHSPGGGSEGGGATTIDCSEAIDNEGPGVAVVTPSGSVLVNCHIHINGSTP